LLGSALSDIARAACQSEVVGIFSTTETNWGHVVDLELDVENDFWRRAILASASCASGDDRV
jgi:hypothetical protein